MHRRRRNEVEQNANTQHRNSRLFAQHRRQSQKHAKKQTSPLPPRSRPATELVRFFGGDLVLPHRRQDAFAVNGHASKLPRPITVGHILLQVHDESVVLGAVKLLYFIVPARLDLDVFGRRRRAALGVPVLDVGDVGQEGQEVEIAGGEVRSSDHSGHGFRVYGMRRKYEAGDGGSYGQARFGEDVTGDPDQERRGEAVEEDVDQMVAPWLETSEKVV